MGIVNIIGADTSIYSTLTTRDHGSIDERIIQKLQDSILATVAIKRIGV